MVLRMASPFVPITRGPSPQVLQGGPSTRPSTSPPVEPVPDRGDPPFPVKDPVDREVRVLVIRTELDSHPSVW